MTKRFLKFNLFTLVLLRDFIIDLFRIHGKVEGEKTSALYHTSLWNLNTNPILCPFSSQYFIIREIGNGDNQKVVGESERNQMGERELWRKEHSIDLDKEIWRRKIRSEL